MSEQRLIELETRLAWQEDSLRQLDDVVAAQQTQIERLERRCAELLERLQSVGQAGDAPPPDAELPPHY